MQNHFVLRASKRVAAVATTGLIATSLGVMATTTSAQAESELLNYDCEVPILGAQTFTVQLDSDAPETIQVGETVSTVTTATVNVPDNVRGAVHGLLGGRTVSGTAEATGFVNEVEETIAMTVPETEVPDAGELAIVASGDSGELVGENVGDTITLSAGDFTSSLVFLKEDGTEALAADIPCTLQEGQNATVDTVEVVEEGPSEPAESTTTVTVAPKQGPWGKVRKVTVKVDAGETPAAGTATVKAGAVTRNVAITDGMGTANLPANLKVGNHTVTASYAGSETVAASSGSANVRIVKAGSKTTVKPTFMRKVNRLRAVSTVKVNTGPKAAGKVKVVVKRNGKQIRQKLVKVNPNGKAPAVFAKMPKKGNFVIISRYMGSPNVKASQQRVVRKLK